MKSCDDWPVSVEPKQKTAAVGLTSDAKQRPQITSREDTKSGNTKLRRSAESMPCSKSHWDLAAAMTTCCRQLRGCSACEICNIQNGLEASERVATTWRDHQNLRPLPER